MEKIIYLSLIAASVSFTVTETGIFQPLRDGVKKYSFIGKLFSCGYCFGYWVALGLVAVYRPRLFEMWWPLDYLCAALIIAWFSAFQWAAMCWLMDKAGK